MSKMGYDDLQFSLTEKDLAEQLLVLLQDDFKATLKVEDGKVVINFTNGQTFALEVKEIK